MKTKIPNLKYKRFNLDSTVSDFSAHQIHIPYFDTSQTPNIFISLLRNVIKK